MTFAVAVGPNAQFSDVIFAAGGAALPFTSAALNYNRVTGVLKMKLDRASGGNVGAALSLSTLMKEGVAVSPTETAVSPEVATVTAPGTVSGAGTQITRMSAVTAGTLYLISYEVTDVDLDSTLFLHAGGPFEFQTIPANKGVHHVLATAADADTGDAIRKGGAGDITVASMSIKRAEWNYTVPANSEGDLITFAITRGDKTTEDITVEVPTANEFYLAPTGNDTLGTGSAASPFRQWAGLPRDDNDAILLGAGDIVEFDAGEYDVFSEADMDGADGNPIKLRAATGAERQVTFKGTLESHVYYGGNGPPDGFVSEDGIFLLRCSWIDLEHLHTTQVARHGINITECHNINIQGPKVDHTGDAGIYVVGKRFSTPIATDGSEDALTTNVRVWGFDDSITNEPTDSGFSDDTGRRGGANEAITVGNGVDGFILEDGDIHDTLQYGFDFKSGVKNAVARRIRIWNVEKFGFYLDAGERGIRNIDVHDITIWNVQTGFSIAREIDGNTNGHDVSNIRISNIQMFNINGIGIYGQKHPKDVAAIADGRSAKYENVSIRFVTVYNANRTGGFASVRLDDFSGIGTGIDLVGVVVHDGDKDIVVVDNWTGETGFTVDDNLNLASGAPTDPLFVAPDTVVIPPTTHRGPATLPDFSLQETSPAKGIVTTASYIAAPFNVGAGGNTRVIPADAGANAPAIAAPVWVSGPSITDLSITFTGSASAVKVVWAFSETAPTYTEAGGWVGVTTGYATGSQTVTTGENAFDINSGTTPEGETTLYAYLVASGGQLSSRESLAVTIASEVAWVPSDAGAAWQFRIDAEDFVNSPTGFAVVTSLPDQSTNNRDYVNPEGSATPSAETVVENGLNVLDFDTSANSQFNAAPWLSALDEMVIVMVAQVPNTVQTVPFSEASADEVRILPFRVSPTNSGANWPTHGDASGFVVDDGDFTAPVHDDTWKVYTVRIVNQPGNPASTAQRTELYINNVLSGFAEHRVRTPTAGAIATIGYFSNGGFDGLPFRGRLASIAVYSDPDLRDVATAYEMTQKGALLP